MSSSSFNSFTAQSHVTSKDSDTRYRARKFVTFLGYVLAIFVIAIVYSSRLGGLTVAFGVAGAGIAFALQEVIASIAGWAASRET